MALESTDTRAVATLPFLDFPLAIAAKTFAMESRFEQEMTPCQESMSTVSRGRLAEVNMGVCNAVLNRLAE